MNKRVVEALIRVGAFDQLEGTRPQLLSVYESLLDANAGRRKQTVTGQLSLFEMAGLGDEPLLTESRRLPNVPDYTLRQRLAAER